jgi:diphosphoinositol-polyphosphate diphosphatase
MYGSGGNENRIQCSVTYIYICLSSIDAARRRREGIDTLFSLSPLLKLNWNFTTDCKGGTDQSYSILLTVSRPHERMGSKAGETVEESRAACTKESSKSPAAVRPRSVAVAIPYSIASDGIVSICLVTSRKHDDRYVLPKGGVEKGESSREAAVREMWEEAGLRPLVGLEREGAKDGARMTTILDHKPHKKSPVEDPSEAGFVARAEYEAHEVRVGQGQSISELEDWPEQDERRRKWVSVQEALHLIEWRKDIHQLLIHSSLVK